MKTENLKIKDIINHLNSLLSVLMGVRVQMGLGGELKKDVVDFHGKVSELINSYLKTFGLRYATWAIYNINDIHDELFELTTPNFIEDKRYKFSEVGEVVEIVIKPEHNFHNVMNMTLEEYHNHINIEKVNASIVWQKQNIKQLEINLNSNKYQLEQSEQELQNLLNKHKVN